MYASVARFCVRNRRWVLLAWVLLFAVGIVVGSQVFNRLKDTNGASGAESVQGSSILDKASSAGPSAVVLVKGPAVAAASTRTAVQTLTARLERLPQVTGAVNAYTSPDPRLRAGDGHASLIVVSVRKNASMTAQHMAVDAMRSAAHGMVPGAQVQVGGDLAVSRDGMAASQNDLFRGELIALPILLIALFFIFGGLRAALLPIFAALATTAGALLLLMGMTHLTDVASYAVDVIILFGLALAVDYSLLMVNRFREARAAGHGITAAVEHTEATAGRTVTFSALTVAAALAGLFAFGDPTFTSVAVGGIATVLVALAAALTLIPALLAMWGAKLKPARRPITDDGFFGRLARRVQARPWLAAGGVTALLLAAALPFLHANYGLGDPRTLPASSQEPAGRRYPGGRLSRPARRPRDRRGPHPGRRPAPGRVCHPPCPPARGGRGQPGARPARQRGRDRRDPGRAPPRAPPPSTWSPRCEPTGPRSAPGSPAPRPS